MTLEHFDVVVVGAGISGLGAGAHLTMDCPNKSFLILESRDQIGGTWDLFRYPGIRSDSDMFTLGFSFKPWKEDEAIARGDQILKYLQETVDEYDLQDKIRFGHSIKSAAWDSSTATWTVDVQRKGSNEVAQFTCNFLFMCTGYYDYENGYTPDFAGVESFGGEIIHPQKWTSDVEYAGKRVIVIGSGATAVTLVPELAKHAAHVTMLQRTPTYMVARPAEDELANRLRGKLPARLAYGITRWKKIILGRFFFKKCEEDPEGVKRWLVNQVKENIGEDYDVEKHFTPPYNPWEQRLCLVTNGDLFQSIKNGEASVVTEHIDRFTEKGILLKSGEELDADLVVTATGLNLKFMANLDITVDGKNINPSDTMSYKGMMFSDIPNLALSSGYTNASWTLKCDLTCDYLCRILNHMDKKGYAQITPRLNDPDIEEVEWMSLKSGYVERAKGNFPKQGSKMPWKLHQNYFRDILMLGFGKVEDGVAEFTKGK
jgi:monooxygenase